MEGKERGWQVREKKRGDGGGDEGDWRGEDERRQERRWVEDMRSDERKETGEGMERGGDGWRTREVVGGKGEGKD